ncbi:MAG: transposase [Polyangiaceae bacterium]|nr:transposase [Polyangiaceae bacterium]
MPRSRRITSQLSRRRWSDADARVVLAALEASGLSVNAFAAREGLDPQRLYYWRKRLDGDSALAVSPTFVEVPRHGPEPVEIALRSGRSLRVRESIDVATLRRFVAVLEEDAAC